jgi:hypothetical protein
MGDKTDKKVNKKRFPAIILDRTAYSSRRNKKGVVFVPLQVIDLQEDGVHPLVEVSIFGKPFLVVLDTGASKTAFDQSMLLQANESLAVTITDHLSTGLGTNSMVSSTAVIHDLCIGDLRVDEFEVAVLDLSTINTAYRQLGHPEVLGVLGGDLLMKYRAVINYGKRIMKLKPKKKTHEILRFP